MAGLQSNPPPVERSDVSPLPRSGPASRRGALVAVALSACVAAAAATTAAPAQAGPGVRDPLTGVRVASTGPVIAIKVANTPQARPQSGLRSADQVWVEEQEGGWTRFIALYGSAYPTKVGPVRSVRETDLGVLGQFGRPGLAYAGGDAPVVAKVAASASVRNLGSAAVVNGAPIRPLAYATDRSRKVPYNFYANAARLKIFGNLAGATKARHMGFVFAAPKTRGIRTSTLGVVWSKNASMQAVWSKKLGAFVMMADKLVLLDRETKKPLTAKNIVVMRVSYSLSKINRSRYPVPVLRTVGRGAVTVLRDGARWTGTWNRPTAASGTSLLNARGRTITLAAGQTWVMLVPVGRSLNKPYVIRSVTVR